MERRAGPWDSRDAAGPGMPPHAVEAAVRLPPPAPLPATPPASPLEAPSPTGVPYPGAPHPAALHPAVRGAHVPVVVGRALSWMSGIRAVTALERRIELKISTMVALALSGAIILVLVLTYLRLPPKEDALLASFLPDSGRIVEKPRSGATAAGNEEGERRSDLRSLPLWSPSSAPPGEPILPAPSTAKPDLRNVESLPGADASTEPPSVDSPAAGGGTGGEPSAERFVYLIQVRGKENMEGARRILDYLANFGFDRQKTEPDPRGVKNSEGKPFYTVFVGPYEDRAEADRECSRLKRLTRDRPFRNRPDFSDFFEDALVITRTESNDKARSAPPP